MFEKRSNPRLFAGFFPVSPGTSENRERRLNMYRSFVDTLLVFGIVVFCLLGFTHVPAQTKSNIFDRSTLREIKRAPSLLSNPAADLDQCANGGVGSPPVIRLYSRGFRVARDADAQP